MRLNVIALAIAAAALGTLAANADEVVVKERTGPNGVVIKEHVGAPDVVVKKKSVTTGSSDCVSRSTTRTNPVTDNKTTRTVRRCD
jgi:hypothetical protein